MSRLPVLLRVAIAGAILAAPVACTQGAPEAAAERKPVQLGSELTWEAVEGAVEYRIQLWDGTRLLFEEVREQPVLEVTPVMERSLLGVSSCELQVRALGPDGREIGPVERQQFTAPGE